MDSTPLEKFGNPEVDEWVDDIDFMMKLKSHVASLIVQKCWRGYLIRCKYLSVKHYRHTQYTIMDTLPSELMDLKDYRDLDQLVSLNIRH
jgi:hypothetical protein